MKKTRTTTNQTHQRLDSANPSAHADNFLQQTADTAQQTQGTEVSPL